MAMVRGGRTPDAAVPALVRMLSDDSGEMRALAVSALGNVCGRRQIVSHVLRTSKDGNPCVRGAAASALADLCGEEELRVARLAEMISDGDGSVRIASIEACEEIGQASKRSLRLWSER